MHHVFNAHLLSHKVNAQQAGVAVRGVEGLETVTKLLLYCQTSQTAAQILYARGKDYMMLLFFRKVGFNHASRS